MNSEYIGQMLAAKVGKRWILGMIVGEASQYGPRYQAEWYCEAGNEMLLYHRSLTENQVQAYTKAYQNKVRLLISKGIFRHDR